MVFFFFLFFFFLGWVDSASTFFASVSHVFRVTIDRPMGCAGAGSVGKSSFERRDGGKGAVQEEEDASSITDGVGSSDTWCWNSSTSACDSSGEKDFMHSAMGRSECHDMAFEIFSDCFFLFFFFGTYPTLSCP